MSRKPFATKVASLFPCCAKGDPLPRGSRWLLQWTLEVSHIENLHGGPKGTRDRGVSRHACVMNSSSPALVKQFCLIGSSEYSNVWASQHQNSDSRLKALLNATYVIEIEVPKLAGLFFQLSGCGSCQATGA